MDYTPLFVTLKLALITTIVLFLVALPIAYFLAFSKFKGKVFLESIFTLPLVLPPTVLGFYYLIYLGPATAIGSFFENTFGLSFAFSFEGILIGSVLFSFPFMLNPLVNGFRAIPKNLIEATFLLNKRRLNAVLKVYLPLMKRSVLSACLLTFAHTIGEFGLVLMIGGNIEETQVASVAIYNEMNAMNYEAANQFALALLILSFIMILVLNLFKGTKPTSLV